MQVLKLCSRIVLGAALALTAISFGPGREGGRMVGENLAWGREPGNLGENTSLAQNAAEKRILSVLADIRQGPWRANVVTLHGRLLRILTEAVKAQKVVEIGTSNGYSSLWICLGLKATGGKLITHEIDPESASLAEANFRRAGVEDLVTVVQGDAHETVGRLQGPIDLLFIDADKPGYLDYLHQLLPLVRPGGLILADNMHEPKPSPDFIQAITTDPHLETIFLNMQSTGISLTLKKP